ncbi:MAG TPA: response regulator [Acidobacteriaceae bacterium]|nr:response regulator [Acidobacteriaceae bacterium]
MRADAIYATEEFPKGHAPFPVSSEEGAEPRRERRRVLVVDDQRLIADTLAEILANEGFEAVAAYDGWEALEQAARFRPDWLLSDVLMPRMNGVELAIAVQKNYPKTDILLFSGQAGISEILEDGHRRGYRFELMAKPVHPLKLVERLKRP